MGNMRRPTPLEGCLVASLAAFALSLMMPMPADMSMWAGMQFWLGLLPALMDLSFHRESTGREQPRGGNGTLAGTLAPLPNVIDGRSSNWMQQFKEVWPREPVVIRGLVFGEPARFGNITSLDEEELKRALGDQRVGVFTHNTNDKSVIDMPFSDFLDQMTDRERTLYARAIPDPKGILTSILDGSWIARLVGLPLGYRFTLFTAKGGSTQGKLPMLFIGSNHVSTQVHCDVGSSTFIMVVGRKRWILYPPSQTPYLYPYGQYRNVAFNAGLDAFHPDLGHTPQFAKARGYEVILNPGDVLFFPSFWWHGVQNIDTKTVGVDFPIIDMVGSIRRNMPLTLLSVLNPFVVYDVLRSWQEDVSLRDVFFRGYKVEQEL